MDLSAFKAYDIRGDYPSAVNEELTKAVGRSFVRYLSAKNIVVGMDMRQSSLSLHKALIEGINCEGSDVFDIGFCSTPMLSSSVVRYGYDGGIMISASHSPGNENGLKLIDATGNQISEGFGLGDIKLIIEKGFGECLGSGVVIKKSVLVDYLENLIPLIDSITDLNIVVDYSSGMGSFAGKPLFARLNGIKLTELNAEPDGTFPSHPANPHDEANFSELIEKVKETGADIGFFFDGDADRVQAVDEIGQIVPMDLLFCLLAKEELQKDSAKGKEFYYDLRFSKVVPEFISSFGGKPVMMRVGNPFYKKALSHSGVLAAEFSGHVMYKENKNIDDGLFCALKTLKMLSQKNQKLSELILAVKKYETSSEFSLFAKNPEKVFEKIKSEFVNAKEVDLDGLYLDFSDGFISVRQSQTEPDLFRVRVEAKTKKEMENRLSLVFKNIKS